MRLEDNLGKTKNKVPSEAGPIQWTLDNVTLTQMGYVIATKWTPAAANYVLCNRRSLYFMDENILQVPLVLLHK